jgi:hypothetical protein
MIDLARDLLPLVPPSWSATTRPINVIWSTGAAVQRDGNASARYNFQWLSVVVPMPGVSATVDE